MNFKREIIIFFTAILTICCPEFAQCFNDFSISWKYIETEHFYIIYHSDSKKTAAEVASKCEKFYADISKFFKVKPDWKISIVVKNTDDISNGFAMYTMDNVTLWTSNLHFPIRDKHRWIDNVLYHELTHIFQQKISSKTSPYVPAGIITFGAALLRSNKYPVYDPIFQAGGIAPLITQSVPSWFVEGIAQFVSSTYGDENYDPVREMILRTLVLERKMPRAEDILNFRNKRGVKAEMVYNLGFNIVSFINKKYGRDKLSELAREASKLSFPTFSMALKKITGHSFDEIYKTWNEEVTGFVRKVTSNIKSPDEDRILIKEKYVQLYPVPVVNGLYYLSVSLSGKKSYIKILKDGKEKPEIVVKSVNGKFDSTPDGNLIVFVRREYGFLNRLETNLFLYNVQTGKTLPIPETTGMREPSISPNGRMIAAIKRGDGSFNLRIIDLSGKVLYKYDVPYGYEIHSPHWSPDGKKVAVEVFDGKNLDIGIFDIRDEKIRTVTKTESNERNPYFLWNNKILYSRYDENRIYNIYLKDIKTGEEEKLTNTLKGNFMPALSSKNRLFYSCFTSKGFKMCYRDLKEKDLKTPSNKTEKANFPFFEPLSKREFHLENGRKYYFIPSRVNLYPQIAFADYQANIGATLNFSDQLFKNNFSFRFLFGFKGLQFYDLFYINRNLPVSIGVDLQRIKYILEDQIVLTQSGSAFTLGNSQIYDRAALFLGDRIWKDFYFSTGIIYKKITDEISLDWPPALPFKRRGEWFLLPISIFYRGESLKGRITIMHARSNDLNPELSIDERFGEYQFLLLDGNISYSTTLFGPISFKSSLSAGYINKNVHPYDEFYLGGAFYPFVLGDIYSTDNLPGYPYLSIHGEQYYLLNIMLKYSKSFRAIKLGTEVITLHGFSFSVFTDVGGAFSAPERWDKLRFYSGDLKKDAGLIWQVKMNLFYNIPWDFFLMVAYPFDNVEDNYDSESPGKETYPHRGKVKIYMGIGVLL